VIDFLWGTMAGLRMFTRLALTAPRQNTLRCAPTLRLASGGRKSKNFDLDDDDDGPQIKVQSIGRKARKAAERASGAIEKPQRKPKKMEEESGSMLDTSFLTNELQSKQTIEGVDVTFVGAMEPEYPGE
jgi:hypothetical protein